MDFGSFDLDSNNNVLKSPYALPTTTAAQQHHNTQHHPTTTHANVDFLSFTHNDFGSMSLDLPSHAFDSYNVPQLTPDGRDHSNCTNSSVLTGQNPDYTMSPLQISTSNAGAHHPQAISLEDMTNFNEDELQDFLSPLVSPAIVPAAHHRNMATTTTTTTESASFSPLTSPALHSVSYHQFSSNNNMDQHLNQLNSEQLPESVLQQKLAMIEQQQQLLRSAHRHLHPGTSNSSTNNGTPSSSSSVSSAPNAAVAATQEIQHSPAGAISSRNNVTYLSQQQQPSSSTADIAPATPSLLMKLGRGNKATTPSTSNNNPTSAVDNMGSLPAAMLDDKIKATGKKVAAPAPSKRRKTSRSSAVFTSPGLTPTHHMLSPRPTSDPTIAALVSPAALRPQLPGNNPSSSSSPRALKPLISPSMKPNGKRLSPLEEQAALAALATKSNYQNMREGNAKSLGIDFSSSFQSGVENRRSAHKAAEQKRRDILKQSFDSLRKEIASALVEEGGTFRIQGNNSGSSNDGQKDNTITTTATTSPAAATTTMTEEEKEKMVKQMSKVVLIQHSYEYILKLKADNRQKDDQLSKLKDEIQSLKRQLKGLADTSTTPTTTSKGEDSKPAAGASPTKEKEHEASSSSSES